ncbi:MAG: DUF2804 domain-containing protein [Clostridiales bacterium]|nr:DUF2804 domain-containing protein [Clostridiales bacterium]
MRNHEVTQRNQLLTPKGELREPGWSKSLVQIYDRKAIKKRKTRIKEWDYYSVISNKNNIAVCFTVSDLGYIEMDSVTFIDFSVPTEHTQPIILPFPMGKLNMPSTTEKGDVKIKNNKLALEFIVKGDKRIIRCDYPSFDASKGLKVNITLENPSQDTMVIATPWSEDKQAFYYNQKINCMAASGNVEYDGKIYELSPETDFGGLDWGRGVWTYDNYWYWGSGSGMVDGHLFGFNIGYGFGDTSAASENVIFYDRKAHKIDDVTFNISENYIDPWTFTSSDGRFEMDFVPIIDRSDYTNALNLIITDQHQVFGKMSGKAVLDDGTVIEIKDFLCFAEKVHNKY